MFAVELKGISKSYSLSNRGAPFSDKPRVNFRALKDVNLKVQKGERIGIFGPNGAGKTTLLKIIAGITKQTYGSVVTRGKIAALIDLEAGFHPDLTGEENIFLNGMIMGMTKPEIKKKLNQIMEFAEIGKFIYQPFFTYSAGMKFRLGFSLAIASDFDVLIMDEVFTAGDINFQNKTFSAIKKLQREKPNLTTIMCSHLPLYIWEFSKRFIELSHGIMREMPRKEMLEKVKARSLKWRQSFSILKKLSMD